MKNLNMSPHRAEDLDTLSRIKSASRVLQCLTSIGLVLVVVASVGLTLNPAWFDAAIGNAFPDLVIATGITPIKRIGMICLAAFPITLVFYGLWHLRLLFVAYRHGRIFSDEAPDHLLKVGLAMAGNALAAMILHPLGSLILTYDNLVGSRHLSVSMSSNTYTLILTGGLLIVIGWVMREAARISDENRQFV